MNVDSEPLAKLPTQVVEFDFDVAFRTQYPRIARVIARMVRDPARAEELAAEVFWKLSQTPKAQGANSAGWLYRTATRMGLDELRRQLRREKFERLLSFNREIPTPEQLHIENEEQRRVRHVLARLKRIQAELLILRSEGFTYEEIAQVLDLNPVSIGTLLRRAEETFRKEFVRRYGRFD